MVVDNLDEELHRLVDEGKWQQILSLSESIELNERNRYLWAWPTVKNLNFLKEFLQILKIQRILSIGCGSGLLEWLIQESCGVSVQGLELDKSWWRSQYSPRPFIELKFTENPITSEFLLQCSEGNDWNFALLFCYFNNHSAFLEYLRTFKGKYLIIIGPGQNLGIHTDPAPFEPNFEKGFDFNLIKSCELSASNDFIAIYSK